MSRFSQSFKQALAEHGWNSVNFSAASGIPPSTVSRWLRGTVVPCSETLPSIISPFSDTTKATLLCAYLQDIAERIKPGIFAITPNPSPPTQKSRSKTLPEGLSDKLSSQIYRIAEQARDIPEVAAIIRNFANCAPLLRRI